MTNSKQQTAVDILCGKLAMKLGIPQAITFYIDHQEEIREAKAMQKQQAEHYATFITNCVINNLPTITFNDWINLHNNEQQ